MRLESALNLRDELLEEVPGGSGLTAYAAGDYPSPDLIPSGARDVPVVGDVINAAGSVVHAAATAVAVGVGVLVSPAVDLLTHRGRLRHPALGVAPAGAGDYRLAVRIPYERLEHSPLVRRIRQAASDEVDVRVTGAISTRPPQLSDGHGFRARRRPVQIGYSVGHPQVTAGTIGCFVRTDEDSSLHLLSCNHVLADCGRGAVGDPILQPGRLDQGSEPDDAIGQLTYIEPLESTRPNTADVALCRVDDAFAPADPADLGTEGRLSGVAGLPRGDELVDKLGRTTRHTRGRVSAFGMRVPDIDYGDGLWITLAEQIEIEGMERSFSDGGDSGSLVYLSDSKEGFAILNAGDEYGYSFASPLPLVLTDLNLTLAR
jgi:hypothetical protein